MAVVALASASGSPGVTTTALGLALLWPRPVLLVHHHTICPDCPGNACSKISGNTANLQGWRDNSHQG